MTTRDEILTRVLHLNEAIEGLQEDINRSYQKALETDDYGDADGGILDCIKSYIS